MSRIDESFEVEDDSYLNLHVQKMFPTVLPMYRRKSSSIVTPNKDVQPNPGNNFAVHSGEEFDIPIHSVTNLDDKLMHLVANVEKPKHFKDSVYERSFKTHSRHEIDTSPCLIGLITNLDSAAKQIQFAHGIEFQASSNQSIIKTSQLEIPTDRSRSNDMRSVTPRSPRTPHLTKQQSDQPASLLKILDEQIKPRSHTNQQKPVSKRQKEKITYKQPERRSSRQTSILNGNPNSPKKVKLIKRSEKLHLNQPQRQRQNHFTFIQQNSPSKDRQSHSHSQQNSAANILDIPDQTPAQFIKRSSKRILTDSSQVLKADNNILSFGSAQRILGRQKIMDSTPSHQYGSEIELPKALYEFPGRSPRKFTRNQSSSRNMSQISGNSGPKSILKQTGYESADHSVGSRASSFLSIQSPVVGAIGGLRKKVRFSLTKKQAKKLPILGKS